MRRFVIHGEGLKLASRREGLPVILWPSRWPYSRKPSRRPADGCGVLSSSAGDPSPVIFRMQPFVIDAAFRHLLKA